MEMSISSLLQVMGKVVISNSPTWLLYTILSYHLTVRYNLEIQGKRREKGEKHFTWTNILTQFSLFVRLLLLFYQSWKISVCLTLLSLLFVYHCGNMLRDYFLLQNNKTHFYHNTGCNIYLVELYPNFSLFHDKTHMCYSIGLPF